jgi:hypothetical protein
MSGFGTDRDPIETLAGEFRQRTRRGERTTRKEYTQQHPDLTDQIADRFPGLTSPDDPAAQASAVTRSLTAGKARSSPRDISRPKPGKVRQESPIGSPRG